MTNLSTEPEKFWTVAGFVPSCWTIYGPQYKLRHIYGVFSFVGFYFYLGQKNYNWGFFFNHKVTNSINIF